MNFSQKGRTNLSNSGNTLTIEAVGTLTKKLEKGAYVNLQVKYGLIRLVNIRQDLCDQVSNVDLDCPIDEGKITIVKDVQLPKEIPPVSTVPSICDSSHKY